MYTTLISAALFSFLGPRAVHAAEFSVQTPVFTQCELTQFSWDQAKGPYNVLLVNETDPCGQEVADFGQINGTDLSWFVALPAGYNVMIYIEDNEDDEAWSGAITVQKSNDSSCLNTNHAVSYPQLSSSSTTTSSAAGAHPSSSSGSGEGVAGTSANRNAALSARRTPIVPTVILGIVIGLAFAFTR